MDFGTLLHKAQKNEKGGKKEAVRYYSTKFEPPKKEQRNKQQLSENIKKFLAKKEAEEKVKKMVANQKREDLMALRAQDKKATRRVNVMLKRTKSANQSVLQDAIDSNNTSVTLAGPIQPDEDDYGYVSQEAAAYYNKMMEKYSKMPDEPKFSLEKKKKVSTDLNGTKERVKAAIEREKEEAMMPHRRKRKHKELEETTAEEEKEAPRDARSKSKVPPPPPLNFNELLKLAQKKQFEPIIIEPKPKEEERLLTKKQKKEMEREKEWRERREGKLPPLENNKKVETSKPAKPKIVAQPIPTVTKKIEMKPQPKPSSGDKKLVPKPGSSSTSGTSGTSNLTKPKPNVMNREVVKKPVPEIKPKQIPPKDLKPKQFPPKDLKPKQFPPADVRRKEFPPRDVKRKPLLKKRTILDDDEDYDSEMDDFIDDGPEDSEDYSRYISEIFGYDKSKYKHVDDDVDNMESTFAQQMKEEVISTKIGIMEDLEDMKKEEEEKKRKALMKKRKL